MQELLESESPVMRTRGSGNFPSPELPEIMGGMSEKFLGYESEVFSLMRGRREENMRDDLFPSNHLSIFREKRRSCHPRSSRVRIIGRGEICRKSGFHKRNSERRSRSGSRDVIIKQHKVCKNNYVGLAKKSGKEGIIKPFKLDVLLLHSKEDALLTYTNYKMKDVSIYKHIFSHHMNLLTEDRTKIKNIIAFTISKRVKLIQKHWHRAYLTVRIASLRLTRFFKSLMQIKTSATALKNIIKILKVKTAILKYIKRKRKSKYTGAGAGAGIYNINKYKSSSEICKIIQIQVAWRLYLNNGIERKHIKRKNRNKFEYNAIKLENNFELFKVKQMSRLRSAADEWELVCMYSGLTLHQQHLTQFIAKEKNIMRNKLKSYAMVYRQHMSKTYDPSKWLKCISRTRETYYFNEEINLRLTENPLNACLRENIKEFSRYAHQIYFRAMKTYDEKKDQLITKRKEIQYFKEKTSRISRIECIE